MPYWRNDRSLTWCCPVAHQQVTVRMSPTFGWLPAQKLPSRKECTAWQPFLGGVCINSALHKIWQRTYQVTELPKVKKSIIHTSTRSLSLLYLQCQNESNWLILITLFYKKLLTQTDAISHSAESMSELKQLADTGFYFFLNLYCCIFLPIPFLEVLGHLSNEFSNTYLTLFSLIIDFILFIIYYNDKILTLVFLTLLI